MSILRTKKRWDRPRPPSTKTPDLTPDEQAHVGSALRVLRIRFGGWLAVARAMGVTAQRLEGAVGKRGKPGVSLALRAARLVGVPLEDVLSGAWPKAGACPMCGRGEVMDAPAPVSDR